MNIEQIEPLVKEELLEVEQLFSGNSEDFIQKTRKTFLEKVRDTVLEEQSKILESVKHELEDFSRVKNELEGTLIMVEQLEQKLINGES